jgi:predicted ATPase
VKLAKRGDLHETDGVPANLESVRLGAFKSYREQELVLRPMTLLVSRNGSGKSNALDALSLLSLLSQERDVNDLERGDSEVAGLRGGVSGAAPFGKTPLSVGCSVRLDDGSVANLDVTIDVAGRPEIMSETLTLTMKSSPKVLIQSDRQSKGSGISDAKVCSAGQPKTYHLLSSRLAAVQAVGKVPGDSAARRLVLETCEQVVGVLRGVFMLDPVPSGMRQYVRIGSLPDRAGANLSAVVYELRNRKREWARLTELVQALVESHIDEITFAEAKLPGNQLVDVMVALRERAGRLRFTTDARVMSDGTLRYLSIVASLLYLRASGAGGRTLVVEEIENGLFPSQARRVLDLLREEASEQGVRLLATTHSPALLDALHPEDHASVILCDRQKDGLSRLQRLTDHPRYVEIAGAGAVGRAITRGELERESAPRARTVAELFGA